MHGPTVVVGIDDSLSARTALAWAADWAQRSGARLRAVHVQIPEYAIPNGWYPAPMGWVPVSDLADEPQAYRERITKLFDHVTHGRAAASLEFVDGAVGPELVRAARGAALLVIGTRQLHGVARLIEGSVSHYCLSHATCPVLAVPALRTVPAAAGATAAAS